MKYLPKTSLCFFFVFFLLFINTRRRSNNVFAAAHMVSCISFLFLERDERSWDHSEQCRPRQLLNDSHKSIKQPMLKNSIKCRQPAPLRIFPRWKIQMPSESEASRTQVRRNDREQKNTLYKIIVTIISYTLTTQKM